MKQEIETTRIVDRVYGSLREAILTGELLPDAPLSVPELSRRMNVSRSPVREAVLQLVSNGLAVERARKGCAVVRIDLADLLEIHDMRSALEALAISLIRKVRPSLVARLNAQIERQEQALGNHDWRTFITADRLFHECFHDECGNGRLKNSLSNLRLQMEIALIEVAQSQELMARSIAEHKQIVSCFVRNAVQEASEMMRHHIQSTRNRVQARLQNETSPGGTGQ